MKYPGLLVGAVSCLLGAMSPALAQEDAAAPMYVVSWSERPAGSYADYEAAQERVLQLFGGYPMPDSLKISSFVVNVGEYGGTMVVQTDSLADLHTLTTMLAVFKFDVTPVLPVEDAIGAEMAAIGYRKSLESNE